MSDTIRDYLVAYLRAYVQRLDTVVGAIRNLFPDDAAPAQLGALSLWLTHSSVEFSLAANSCDADDARRLL